MSELFKVKCIKCFISGYFGLYFQKKTFLYVSTILGLEQVEFRSEELVLSLPHWCRGPSTWTVFHCLPIN